MTYVWTLQQLEYDVYGVEAVFASPRAAWEWLAEQNPDAEQTCNFDLDGEWVEDDVHEFELWTRVVVSPAYGTKQRIDTYGLERFELIGE